MSLPKIKPQVIIDLNKILNSSDALEIRKMEITFQSNGWCFVILPSEVILDSQVINEISNFFDSNWKHKCSQRFPTSKIYGYSKVNHKEGIKLLTGSYFNELANKGLVPVTLVEPLNYLSQALDAVTKRLIEILDQHSLFQQQPSLLSLIERADLPFQEEQFGMLDIVSYFNSKSGSQPLSNAQTTDEVNCVPHYDPGLLSISILSTYEGLQLKDMISDEWIDGPLEPNIGIIWLGAAASRITENRLKPGIHRVIYPREPKRRLTIWYEVCTTEQLRNISMDKQDEKMADGSVIFDNLPGMAPINILPGEKKLEFLKRVENAVGLSVTKVGPPRYILQKHDISYPKIDSQTKQGISKQSRYNIIRKIFICGFGHHE